MLQKLGPMVQNIYLFVCFFFFFVSFSNVGSPYRNICFFHLDSINLLVAYGADPNIRDVKSGETPIHVACREGKDSTVRFLAQSCGVSWYGINSQKRVGKYTPLHEACRWGHAGSARVLLGLAEEEEMQSYSQSSSQNQSHHLLKQHDSFQNDDQYSNNSNTDTQHKCLSRLLIEVVNDNHCGVSPIAIASQYGHLQVLWVLIQSGAVRQPCSQWFPKLDPKLHKHLRSWVDAVLDDPRLTLTTTPYVSTKTISPREINSHPIYLNTIY